MADDVYDKYLAKAMFDAALKNGELNKWLSQLRKISDIVNEEEIPKLLLNPKVAYNDKVEVLTSRLGEVNPLVLKMIFMLVAKGKLGEIKEIAYEYQRLLDTYHGVEGAELVEVTTAIPLDEKVKLKLSKRLTDIIGKPIVIKATVDPDMIGGIIIKVGDKLIDGSMRSKLAELKREIG